MEVRSSRKVVKHACSRMNYSSMRYMTYFTLCGLRWFGDEKKNVRSRFADEDKDITCKTCLMILRKRGVLI